MYLNECSAILARGPLQTQFIAVLFTEKVEGINCSEVAAVPHTVVHLGAVDWSVRWKTNPEEP